MSRRYRVVAAIAVIVALGGTSLATAIALRSHRAVSGLEVPEGWPKPQYDFSGNPITPDGFALGRKLFYDPLLSRDGSIACANCHQQFAAFAHAGHRVSHGIGGAEGKRNAPPLFNLAWQRDFMWDGAVHSLELQAVAPLSNPVEMDETLAGVVRKLSATADYPKRFAAAFGSPGVDGQRVLFALTQFMGSIVSSHARYDDVMAKRTDFTALEREGLAVFRENCAQCHAEPLFSDHRFRNNGLDREPVDPGRRGISGEEGDHGRFRVPSLRNLRFSAPYMHDGRFATLEQVLDHYSSGIADSATLDPVLRGGLHLRVEERTALLAFLETLNDSQLVSDRRLADAGD